MMQQCGFIEVHPYFHNHNFRDFEEDGISYNCSEQFLMSLKADTFHDEDAKAIIMGSSNQVVQNQNEMKGFDIEQWNQWLHRS